MARAVVAAAIAVLALGATRAGGEQQALFAQFFLEGGTIYCGSEIPHEGLDWRLACWRPRNGLVVSMPHRGRPDAGLRPGWRRWRPLTEGPLRAGETWWLSRNGSVGRGTPPRGARFRCFARTDGLRCVNAAGRGWWLGRHRGFRLT